MPGSGLGAGDLAMNIPHSKSLYSREMCLICGVYLGNVVAENKMNWDIKMDFAPVVYDFFF